MVLTTTKASIKIETTRSSVYNKASTIKTKSSLNENLSNEKTTKPPNLGVISTNKFSIYSSSLKKQHSNGN